MLFVACESESVLKGRNVYKAYFKKNLKDPESFVVYSEKYKENGAEVEWEVDYGAKNEYGGMNRKTLRFSTIGNTIWVDGWSYDLKDLK